MERSRDKNKMKLVGSEFRFTLLPVILHLILVLVGSVKLIALCFVSLFVQYRMFCYHT
jgi:cell division protein FtsX